jgi:hypothetical protein
MPDLEKVGRWAFIAGLVLAIVAGLLFVADTTAPWVTWILAILGLVVGFLNVSTTDPQGFLLPAVALTLSASAVLSLPEVGFVLTNILANAVAFVGAAMLVVAIRALLETAKG